MNAHKRKTSKREETEHPLTLEEHQAVIELLISQGQLETIRENHFCESERNLPIAGTPRPLPCPFCGETDVSIVIQDEKGHPSAKVQCEHCGLECCPIWSTDAEPRDSYQCVLEAARFWNMRKGGAS